MIFSSLFRIWFLLYAILFTCYDESTACLHRIFSEDLNSDDAPLLVGTPVVGPLIDACSFGGGCADHVKV
jgi:hypothetical protein